MKRKFLKKGKVILTGAMSCVGISLLVFGTGESVANASECEETIKLTSNSPVAGLVTNIVEEDGGVNKSVVDTLKEKIEEKKAEEKKKLEKEIEEKTVIDTENVGVVVEEDTINIRKSATTDSEIVGKMKEGVAVKITSTEDDWYNVKSGAVEGYVRKDLLVTGEDKVKELADKYATKVVIATTDIDVVEDIDNTDEVVCELDEDESLEVVENTDRDWVKVETDSTTGYVARKDVTVKMIFEHATSYKDENYAEKEETSEERQTTTSTSKGNTSRNSSNSGSSSSSSKGNSNGGSSTKNSSYNSSSSNSSSSDNSSSSSESSASGQAVVDYAMQFLGNPYVYGGTSLTNGIDCSGFTQAVYAHFGYSIPRTSSAQASSAGRVVSMSSLQKGDLLFYSGHVAIYIGNGKIIHASTPSDGIKISSYNYTSPYRARRIL